MNTVSKASKVACALLLLVWVVGCGKKDPEPEKDLADTVIGNYVLFKVILRTQTLEPPFKLGNIEFSEEYIVTKLFAERARITIVGYEKENGITTQNRLEIDLSLIKQPNGEIHFVFPNSPDKPSAIYKDNFLTSYGLDDDDFPVSYLARRK